MTFREFMLENGYELQTTFWNDFSIADRFGLSAVQDTFNRAFKEWKAVSYTHLDVYKRQVLYVRSPISTIMGLLPSVG